jgi:hypothetical protein
MKFTAETAAKPLQPVQFFFAIKGLVQALVTVPGLMWLLG